MANNGDFDSDTENPINDGSTLSTPINDILNMSQEREDLCSKLIPMHNRLSDVFGAVDNRDEEFNLPEIVVVGPQVFTYAI